MLASTAATSTAAAPVPNEAHGTNTWIVQPKYARLMPYVAALPTTQLKINVNTADAPVIESLSTRVTPGQAETLVQSQRHYEDVGVLVAEVPELGDATDAMAVTSGYFEIRARAEIDGYRTELTSVVHRDPTNGHVTLLTRDFGKRLPSIVEAQENQDDDARSGNKDQVN